MSDPASKLTPEEIEEIRKERRADAIKAIKTRTTTVTRWLNEASTDLWNERAESAARLIPPGTRVLDVGCCDMSLERYLPPGCTYIPLDVVRRDARTLVVDLNCQSLPQIEVDIIVLLGVLEYLHDIPRFLADAIQLAPEALFTYHPLEKTPARDRLALGWVNSLNSPELLALLRGAGYRKIQVKPYKPALHFYRLSR